MNLFFKIFFLLVTIVITSVLMFLTFLSKNYSDNTVLKYDISEWLTEFKKNNISIKIDSIGIANKIYSTDNNYTKKITDKLFSINVWTWIYLFQLNEIGKEYSIEWNWFELK